MNSGIDRLRELTESLPPLTLSETVISGNGTTDDNVVIYGDGDDLVTIGIGVLNIPGIAVQRAIIPTGAKFPRHNHDQHEHLVVYRGKLLVHIERGETIVEAYINPGESVHFLPGEPHWVQAMDTVHLLGVTVPASEAYPGAR